MGLELASPWPRVVSVLHYLRVRPISPSRREGEYEFVRIESKILKLGNVLLLFPRSAKRDEREGRKRTTSAAFTHARTHERSNEREDKRER